MKTTKTQKAQGDEASTLLAALTPAEALVCVMVAEHAEPKGVMAECDKRFGKDKVKLTWIYEVSSWAHRPEKYRLVIEAVRQYLMTPDTEALLDPAWRVRQRRKAYEIALKAEDVPAMLSVLDGVERVQGMVPAAQAGSGHPGSMSMNLQVNNINGGNFGDLNRPPANDAERAAWRRQIEIEFDLPPRPELCRPEETNDVEPMPRELMADVTDQDTDRETEDDDETTADA